VLTLQNFTQYIYACITSSHPWIPLLTNLAAIMPFSLKLSTNSMILPLAEITSLICWENLQISAGLMIFFHRIFTFVEISIFSQFNSSDKLHVCEYFFCCDISFLPTINCYLFPSTNNLLLLFVSRCFFLRFRVPSVSFAPGQKNDHKSWIQIHW